MWIKYVDCSGLGVEYTAQSLDLAGLALTGVPDLLFATCTGHSPGLDLLLWIAPGCELQWHLTQRSSRSVDRLTWATGFPHSATRAVTAAPRAWMFVRPPRDSVFTRVALEVCVLPKIIAR